MTTIVVNDCPFCGWHDVEIDEIEPGRYAVDCPECECIGPFADTQLGAIDAWNLGSDPAAVLPLLVRCEAFIAGFEDDPDQQGIPQLLADLRAHLTQEPTCTPSPTA